ncbi:hypothetical protein [Vibrio barjaei]|uniref:hypothetical protein n=1 Tax=Vibrio barjaei TaxID=1676683 RepID=UPI00228461AC|nr:hypothetical protein [Vibrio barjaei]MCY9874559.1 hypothetical protein [Vibrio barjaei]
MAKQFSVEYLIGKHGMGPDLIVECDPEFKEDDMLDCDFASSYAVFMDDGALGGSMVYGQYESSSNAWVRCSNLRHLVTRLAMRVIE